MIGDIDITDSLKAIFVLRKGGYQVTDGNIESRVYPNSGFLEGSKVGFINHMASGLRLTGEGILYEKEHQRIEYFLRNAGLLIE